MCRSHIGSKNLEDAYGSFQKRRSLQAPNQATYLALTAVKKSDLDFTAKSSATHKFQPERGGKVDSYLSLESAMPIQCLMVAVQNRDGSFEIMQSPNKNIHHSTKYQQKYSQLRAKIQAEINLTFSFIGSVSIQGIADTPSYLSGCRLTVTYVSGHFCYRCDRVGPLSTHKFLGGRRPHFRLNNLQSIATLRHHFQNQFQS
jgi:hypothetical protein